MNDHIVDDFGTTQSQALEIFKNFSENGFDNDIEKLALVLGRTPTEMSNLLTGSEIIDDDLILKIRGIASQRNISLE